MTNSQRPPSSKIALPSAANRQIASAACNNSPQGDSPRLACHRGNIRCGGSTWLLTPNFVTWQNTNRRQRNDDVWGVVVIVKRLPEERSTCCDTGRGFTLVANFCHFSIVDRPLSINVQITCRCLISLSCNHVDYPHIVCHSQKIKNTIKLWLTLLIFRIRREQKRLPTHR